MFFDLVDIKITFYIQKRPEKFLTLLTPLTVKNAWKIF